MQSPAYAHRVKLSNLQQMANTIIYVQEHGFDTQSDLKNTLLASKQELKEMQTQFAQHRSDLRILNDQIRYTGQYYANKEVYSQFSNAKYKGKYRKEHAKEIQKYEEARNWLRSFYQDGKMTSLKTLTLQKKKFMVITVAVVGASRRFLAQITRHQNEVKYMSASLQYSNYSGHAAFAIPYGIMKANKEV